MTEANTHPDTSFNNGWGYPTVLATACLKQAGIIETLRSGSEGVEGLEGLDWDGSEYTVRAHYGADTVASHEIAMVDGGGTEQAAFDFYHTDEGSFNVVVAHEAGDMVRYVAVGLAQSHTLHDLILQSINRAGQ